MLIPTDDPVAVAVTDAIRSGDLDALARLLDGHPGLATASLGVEGGQARSLLHVATDAPGHYPNGPATVAALVAAGADVNARFIGPHTETPLHWAASNDDVAVLDALLDAGADIDALGAVIGGGPPLADAAAFGQWRTARRLVERGARTELWQEAALGLSDRVTARFEAAPPPDKPAVTEAFWCACQGGQLETARFLRARGADVDWVGWDDLTPLGAATREGAADVVAWLRDNGAG